MRSLQPQPRIWDISPPVHEGAPVFPGDTPYQQRWAATISPDCPVNVSEIKLSPHIGAHADAPCTTTPRARPSATSISRLSSAPAG
jgi:arylformamidase